MQFPAGAGRFEEEESYAPFSSVRKQDGFLVPAIPSLSQEAESEHHALDPYTIHYVNKTHTNITTVRC